MSINYDLVKLLLENGADVNVRDDDGNTPLTNALSNGDKEMMKLLLKYGADINNNTIDLNNPLSASQLKAFSGNILNFIKS